MKKILCKVFMIIVSLGILGGCSTAVPNDMQMDIYLGTSKNLKLLHVNASNSVKTKQIEGIYRAISNAQPTDKPMELFAYYPDYTIEIDDLENGLERITVVLDINRDRLEFYYPGPFPEKSDAIYRSDMSVDEFRSYIHAE